MADEIETKLAAAMETVGTLQRKLDEALQKHADDEARHRAEIDTLNAEHKQRVENLAAEAAAEWAKAVADLKAKHEEDTAALKASVLIPALQDMHARQAADLAAKHQAELDRLK